MRYYLRNQFRGFGQEDESGGMSNDAASEAIQQTALAPVSHIDFYEDGSIVTVGTQAVAWRGTQVPSWYKWVALIGIPVVAVAGAYVGKRFWK
jgi:hypothetical protein